MAATMLILASSHLRYMAVLLATILLVAMAALFFTMAVIVLQRRFMVGVRLGLIHDYLR